VSDLERGLQKPDREREFLNSRPARIRTTALVALTTAAALAILITVGLPAGQAPAVFVWFLACLAGEALWIRTPTRRGTISMALTIDLAALFTLNPAGSLLTIAGSTLLAGIYPHRRPWYKVIFNAGQATMAAAGALAVLTVMKRGADPSGFMYVQMTWVPLFAAGLTYFVINSGLVSCAIAFSSEISIWRAWRDNYGYGFELWCTIAQISLSGFVLAAYQQMGAIAVLGLLPVLGVLWWSSAREAQAHGNRLEDTESETEKIKLAG
jgi:hypothetical protein